MSKKSARRTPGRAEKRRAGVAQEILEAARQQLMEPGTDGLRLDAVARKLGLTKAALYYYYPSKEALVFAVVLDELTALAASCHAATEAAVDGPAAIEVLIRSIVAHWATRLNAFRIVTGVPQGRDGVHVLTPAHLALIHPLNDRMFGPTERKLKADIQRGRIPPHSNPRRLAFAAQAAALGLLTMKAMVESVNDPLGHGDEPLTRELCLAFRAAAEKGTP